MTLNGHSGLIMAGGRNAAGQTMAFGKVGRRRMLDRAVEALQRAGIDDIVVVADMVSNPLDPFKVARRGNHVGESVQNGLHLCKHRDVVIMDACAPGITSEAIVAFVYDCLKHGQDGVNELMISYVEAEKVNQEFPGIHTTSIRLGTKKYTLGALFLLHGPIPNRALRWLDDMYEHRKSKIQTAYGIGFGILTKAALNIALTKVAAKWPRLVPASWFDRVLTIEDVEAAMEQRTGMVMHAVQSNFAGVGADVDSEEDREIMDEIFTKRVAHLSVA
jgi:hypothetical protein